jgi:hypothetical protein
MLRRWVAIIFVVGVIVVASLANVDGAPFCVTDEGECLMRWGSGALGDDCFCVSGGERIPGTIDDLPLSGPSGPAPGPFPGPPPGSFPQGPRPPMGRFPGPDPGSAPGPLPRGVQPGSPPMQATPCGDVRPGPFKPGLSQKEAPCGYAPVPPSKPRR